MQAILGYHSEARWLRHARKHLRHLFPLPAAATRLQQAAPGGITADQTDHPHPGQRQRLLARVGVDHRRHPHPCDASRPTVKRSEMAGWANYGYCASHSRYYWGLKLHLACTPAGMPILWALADPKIGEREVLDALLEVDADLVAARPGLLLICDKGFASADFERCLSAQGIANARLSAHCRHRSLIQTGSPAWTY
jgi:Transposase DDE domain